MFACFKSLAFCNVLETAGIQHCLPSQFQVFVFVLNQDRVLCREVDTFVNLILLLIDPYTLLFNGCNSSHYFWHINGKWGFRTKEAVVMWEQEPFTHSGLQQWAVWNSDWMKVRVTQHLLRKLTEHSSNTQDQEKSSQRDINRISMTDSVITILKLLVSEPFYALKNY